MRFVRFKMAGNKPDGASNDEMKGLLEDNGQIRRIYGSYLQTFSVTEQLFDIDDIEYLPPVLPMTILCDNDSHSYIKSPASLAGSGATIRIPAHLDRLFYTPRLCWVVKNRNYDKLSGATIFGFTWMLDFSISDIPSALDSGNCFTVLGRAIDTKLTTSIALSEFATRLKAYAEQISFRPGDIIAFQYSEQQSCQRGEYVSCNDLEVAII